MTTPGNGLSLSLHVLDTARGQPGQDLSFTLSRIEAAGGHAPVASGVTDAAGRWALDRGAVLVAGVYEFVFAAAAYQARFGSDSFYDVIAVRFRMREGGGHTHIPLILSPYGYSTYRGG